MFVGRYNSWFRRVNYLTGIFVCNCVQGDPWVLLFLPICLPFCLSFCLSLSLTYDATTVEADAKEMSSQQIGSLSCQSDDHNGNQDTKMASHRTVACT